MADALPNERLARPIRTTQIIVGALLMGATFFLAISLITLTPAPASTGTIAGLPMFLTVGIGMMLLTRIATGILLSYLQNSTARRIAAGTWKPYSGMRLSGIATPEDDLSDDLGKLLFFFRQRTIVKAAAIEGPAFFFIMCYMIERHPLALILALLMMADLVYQFPTQARMELWLNEQLKRVEELRLLKRMNQ